MERYAQWCVRRHNDFDYYFYCGQIERGTVKNMCQTYDAIVTDMRAHAP